MKRHLPAATLLIHIALAIIVAGAIVTHFCGITGTVTLADGAPAVTRFDKTSGPGDGSFPFGVALRSAEVVFYPASATPMDFRSHITVDGHDLTVAMNSVATYRGWRLYQTAMGAADSTLSVARDPWGIAITYTGYALLGLSMVLFFFQRRTCWRAHLRKLLEAAMIVVAATASAGDLPTMQRPLATRMGRVFVYWNDRVAPMQTMACDVTSKLYGARSYRGMTPEQVLAGWLFWFDDWNRDYLASHPDASGKKEQERRALITWLGTGEAFRIYPYRTASGRLEWLSLTGRRPSAMSLEQWRFMVETMPSIQRLVASGDNIGAGQVTLDLIEAQRRYAAPDGLHSSLRVDVERRYNRLARPLPLALIALTVGGFLLWCALKRGTLSKKRWLGTVATALCGLTALAVAAILAVRGWLGGYVPVSNGPETMLFMGFAASAAALFCGRRRLIQGALMLTAAMALFTAAMASATPRIAALQPVLSSRLLTVHVMLVMTSYVMFLLMAVLAAVGLSRRDLCDRMALTNSALLVPAKFLLTAGIFVGAVWANQSWGRYWGWDPKETCALVTMLIYAVPLHAASLRRLRRPRVLNLYLLLAIVSVLFTYFGANYLLPGLHSYA